MYRTLAAVVTVAFILACGGGGTEGGGKGGGKAGGGPGGDGGARKAKAYTLNSVDEAEIACYFSVTTPKGKDRRIRGVYDACPEGNPGVTKLVGKKVKLTLGKGSEPAPSCGGDFECTDTVEVDVIEAISAL